MSSSEAAFLTNVEVVQRINAIDAITALRLVKIASIYTYGTEWTADDLLQEAFVATLERRRWRADLDTVVFLTGVMRSLAHAKRKHGKVSVLDCAVARDTNVEEHLHALPDSQEQGPEGLIAAEESLLRLVDVLTECFADDPEVQRVIRGRAMGEDASEIRAALGLNPSQYESVCRRMLRGYQTRIQGKM